jgi:4-hydroxybenzoate polyprenyltransferase
MKTKCDFINKYLGWRNWSVLLYNSAIENVFLIMYIALHDRISSPRFLFEFFSFFIFSMFSTTYGYLVNDLSDRDIDRSHGKSNTFQNDSLGKAAIIVALFFGLSIVFAIPFLKKNLFFVLWGCWFLITTFYSLKPIRLKERGKSGLAFAVFGQRVLPALIVFSAFGYWDGFTVFAFTLYILFRGLSSDLNHQLEDFQKDTSTGTNTFAVQAGIAKGQKLLRLSLEIEKGMLFICLLMIYFKIPGLKIYGISSMLPPLVIYLALYIPSLFIATKNAFENLNPYVCGRKSIFHFLHHTFPSVGLPVYLGILISFLNPMFILITIFFIIYRRLYSLDLIMNTFPFNILRKAFAK